MAAIGATTQSAFDPAFLHQRMDERDARYALAGLIQPAPGGVMSYRSGVFAGGAVSGTTLGDANHGGLRVTVGATGSSPFVQVNIGNCLIDTPGNGPYLCSLDSVKGMNLATPHATQKRIDLVVARVYDDRNAAIMTAGERKFVIQIVTGDNTSGTPVAPYSVLPANGWIPLYEVLVNANGSSLVLTDKRGPGLTTRGGRRILYGEDAKITSAAFLEAGAYSGDQRYVVGHPFPNQTYFVSSDAGTAGWRGDSGKLVYTVPAPLGGQAWTTGQGSVRSIVTQAIPAFGIPVVVTASGRLNCDAVSGDTQVEARTRHQGGSLISFAEANNFGSSVDHPAVIDVSGKVVGPFTSAQTFELDAFIRVAPHGGAGFAFTGNTVGQHLLQLVVEPANIDPVKMWL